jgi:hypothetical protein
MARHQSLHEPQRARVDGRLGAGARRRVLVRNAVALVVTMPGRAAIVTFDGIRRSGRWQKG